MEERSVIIHKLWFRVSQKTQNSAKAYPNIKRHSTHQEILTIKLKELLDKVLDVPLSDEDYQTFIEKLIDNALNQQ